MCEKSKVSQPGENKEQPPSKQGNEELKKDLNPNSMPPAPIHSEANPTPITPTNADQEKEHSIQGWKEFNWWKERGELLAFVAAIVIMVINFRQWRDAHEQLAEARKAYKLDERAWVNPYQTTRWSDNGFTNSFYYILRFKNIGRTPAVHVFASIAVADSDNFTRIPKISTIAPTNVSTQPLFPNTENQVQSALMPISVLANAVNKKTVLYVFGAIVYDDIFGKNHWIRYCWVTDPSTAMQYPSTIYNDCDTNN